MFSICFRAGQAVPSGTEDSRFRFVSTFFDSMKFFRHQSGSFLSLSFISNLDSFGQKFMKN